MSEEFSAEELNRMAAEGIEQRVVTDEEYRRALGLVPKPKAPMTPEEVQAFEASFAACMAITKAKRALKP